MDQNVISQYLFETSILAFNKVHPRHLLKKSTLI
jgi:hypothetical protein